MSKLPFDQKIAESLQNLEDPYNPESWDALSQKLDKKPVHQLDNSSNEWHSERFDQQVRAALQEIEAPYQYNHWNKMAKQLSQNTAVQRIKVQKVAEAAIILLFAANFNNFLNNGVQLFKMPVPEKAVPTEIPMANVKQPSKQKRTQSTQETLLNNLVANETTQLAFGKLSVSFPEIALPLPDYHQTEQPQITSELLANPDLSPFALLTTLGIQLPETPTPWVIIPKINLPNPNSKKPRTNVQLMAYTGVQRIQLNSSSGFNTSAYAPTAGFAAALKNGKWGIELGAAYAPISYQTDIEVFDIYQQGGKTFGVSAQEVKSSVTSIPLKATRTIKQWGKNSLHACTGITAHIATSKSFIYQHIPYPAPPQGSPIPGSPTLPNDGGALENGAIQDNFYASLDAGLRYQRQLSPRLIAYAEPIYRHQITGSGFGPQPTKTNTATVQAGLITTL